MALGILASVHGMSRGRRVRSLCAAAICTGDMHNRGFHEQVIDLDAGHWRRYCAP
jgi:hypothetical protein